MKARIAARQLVGAALASALLGFATAGHAITFSGIDVELVGDASIVDGDLQLTPPVDGRSGAAWATTAWSTTENFYSTFTFSLQMTDFDPQADGISFALQATGSGTSGAGGAGVGYEGIDGIAFVFMTWDNNKIGIVDGMDPRAAEAAGVDLGAANLITGRQTITYDVTTTTLSWTADFSMDGTPVSVTRSATIDLQARFGEAFYAGFTGGTGLSYSDQRITSWGTAPVPEPETYALFAAGLGILAAVARRRRIA